MLFLSDGGSYGVYDLARIVSKTLKTMAVFVKQNIEVSDAWKNAFPVSAGTDKGLPYARTESVIDMASAFYF